MEYRRGDVRDPHALREAFDGADVVVHLAFMITGAAALDTIRKINVDGTLNAFRAARDAGAARFVYASSVAAYGFHRDNPVGIDEEWPVRPARRLFYAREKAEIELLLAREAAQGGGPPLYMLRPSVVLGPHTVGAKGIAGAAAGRRLLEVLGSSPVPIPALAPHIPIQLVHERDVGQALLKCVLAEGPPGAYNIAADGVLTGGDIARELGLAPVPVPGGLVHIAARAATALPKWRLPPAVDWVEAFSHPAIMDTAKAKEQLGWRPSYTAVEALRDSLPQSTGGAPMA